MSNIKDVRPQRVFMELGGKSREIKFDLNAFAELETKFGSVEQAMAILQQGSIKGIRTILWVGLIHEEAILDEKTGEPIGYNITPHQVGSWIDSSMLKLAIEQLTTALVGSLPEEEKQEILKTVEVNMEQETKKAKIVYTAEELAEIEKKS